MLKSCWNMNEIIWKITFMIIWIGNGLVRMPHGRNYKKTEKIKSKKTSREKRRALFDKTLVTTGPFRYMRHPMYIGIYIMLTGAGLLFFSKIWFMIMIIFIPVWYLDCKIEEKQMTELHKEKYLNYKKNIRNVFTEDIWRLKYENFNNAKLLIDISSPSRFIYTPSLEKERESGRK